MRAKITVFLMTVWPENLPGNILTWWLNVGVYHVGLCLQQNCFENFSWSTCHFLLLWYVWGQAQDLFSFISGYLFSSWPDVKLRCWIRWRRRGELDKRTWSDLVCWDGCDPFIIKTNVESFILKSKLSVFALEKLFENTEVMILVRFIFKNFSNLNNLHIRRTKELTVVSISTSLRNLHSFVWTLNFHYIRTPSYLLRFISKEARSVLWLPVGLLHKSIHQYL